MSAFAITCIVLSFALSAVSLACGIAAHREIRKAREEMSHEP